MNRKFYIRETDITEFEVGFSCDYLKKNSPHCEHYTNVLALPSEDVKPLDSVSSVRKGILLGNFRDCWGHNLLDDILRVWFTFTDDYKKLKAEGVKLYAFKMHGKPLSGNFIKLLHYLDIEIDDVCIITEPTEFSELVIPDKSVLVEDHGQVGRYYYPEYKKMIEKVISQIPTTTDVPEKVYFSRTHFRGKFNFMARHGREFGEDRIEQVFRHMGFEIVYPEQKTLEEQIQILQGCKYFATTEGSIAHNLLFAKKGITSIVLRKSYYYNTYQSMVSHLVGANVIYVDAHNTFLTITDPWSGPFYLCVTKHLQNFAKDMGHIVKPNTYISDFFMYIFESITRVIRLRKIPKFE